MIRINLLPKNERRQKLPLKRLFTMVFTFFTLLFVMLYGLGLYEESLMESERGLADAHYQLLQQSQQRKENAEKKQREISARNAVLVDLSKNTQSMHAVMVHLGGLAVSNVWLKDVAFSGENAVTIQGNASSYEYLSGFLKKFEDDTLLTKVVLKGSSLEKVAGKDVVKFEITADFKGL